jgi:hypothetical protein
MMINRGCLLTDRTSSTNSERTPASGMGTAIGTVEKEGGGSAFPCSCNQALAPARLPRKCKRPHPASPHTRARALRWRRRGPNRARQTTCRPLARHRGPPTRLAAPIRQSAIPAGADRPFPRGNGSPRRTKIAKPLRRSASAIHRRQPSGRAIKEFHRGRGTERRYGAGGEDGNFVAACNRWSARCPSRTT